MKCLYSKFLLEKKIKKIVKILIYYIIIFTVIPIKRATGRLREPRCFYMGADAPWNIIWSKNNLETQNMAVASL